LLVERRGALLQLLKLSLRGTGFRRLEDSH
jgi:hypothetical protein